MCYLYVDVLFTSCMFILVVCTSFVLVVGTICMYSFLFVCTMCMYYPYILVIS